MAVDGLSLAIAMAGRLLIYLSAAFCGFLFYKIKLHNMFLINKSNLLSIDAA